MEATEKQMFESSLIEDSEGAKIVDFTKHVPGKEGKGLNKALIRKRHNSSAHMRLWSPLRAGHHVQL